MRLPRRDGPGKTEWELLSFDVGPLSAFLLFRLKNDLGAGAWLRKKRRAGVAWEVDDNGARHAICNTVVVWMVACCENNIHDGALAAVHDAVLYSQVMQKQDERADCQFQTNVAKS